MLRVQLHRALAAMAIRRYAVSTILALTVTLAAGAANASLIFTIERTSDQVARISATGSLDGLVPTDTLYYLTFGYSVSGGGTSLFASTAGDFELGGKTVQQSGVAIGLPHLFVLDFVADLALGDSPAGKALITLDASDVWAPVGTSNSVLWGVLDVQTVGRFSIIAAQAPEPSTLALFGLGLAGLIFARRRNRKRTAVL